MFKKVYILYSAFCTQRAFYSQSAVCILHSVCILPLVRSLQSAVRSLRFTLTGSEYYILRKFLGVKFHITNIYMTTIRFRILHYMLYV